MVSQEQPPVLAAVPATSKVWAGEVVPIPTLPSESGKIRQERHKWDEK